MKPYWLPLLLTAFCRLSQAGCSLEVEQALRHANPRAPITGDLVSQDCRPWSVAPQRVTAAVMAFEQETAQDSPYRSWDVVIALVDNPSRQVQSSFRVEVGEDGTTLIGRSSLSLDSAPYELKPGVKALGVRFSSDRGIRLANWRGGTPLRLFVPEGDRLRPVFCESMGWQDAGMGVIGQDEWNEADTTLVITSGSTRGWRNLRLTDDIRHMTAELASTSPAQVQRTCRYDGERYRCEPPKGSAADTRCDAATLP